MVKSKTTTILIMLCGVIACMAGDGGYRNTYNYDTLIITTLGHELISERKDTCIIIGSVQRVNKIDYQLASGGGWRSVVEPYQYGVIIKRGEK